LSRRKAYAGSLVQPRNKIKMGAAVSKNVLAGAAILSIGGNVDSRCAHGVRLLAADKMQEWNGMKVGATQVLWTTMKPEDSTLLKSVQKSFDEELQSKLKPMEDKLSHKTRELSDACWAEFVSKKALVFQEGLGLHYHEIKEEVNKVTQLAPASCSERDAIVQALRDSKGLFTQDFTKEVPSLSPEEQIDWAVDEAQRIYYKILQQRIKASLAAFQVWLQDKFRGEKWIRSLVQDVARPSVSVGDWPESSVVGKLYFETSVSKDFPTFAADTTMVRSVIDAVVAEADENKKPQVMMAKLQSLLQGLEEKRDEKKMLAERIEEEDEEEDEEEG